MINFSTTYYPLFKFMMIFTLFFIFCPYQILKNSFKNFLILEKFIFSFCIINLFLIISTHLLVFVKIYETISLYIFLIIIIFLFKKFSFKKNNLLNIIFETCESKNIMCRIVLPFKLIIKIYLEKINVFFTKTKLLSPMNILLFLLLLLAAFIRFKLPINQLYLFTDDSYVHLTWAKYFSFNKLYVDGIYPYGFEAIISSINKLSFMDPYFIIRFIGSLTSLLIVISIVIFIHLTIPNYKSSTTFLTIFIYIIYINPLNPSLGLPIDLTRQISALSMEYAILFILPGIYCLQKFYDLKIKSYLILSSICLAVTLLIHLYTAFFLVSAYVIISIYNFKKIYSSLSYVLLNFTVFALLGLMPILLGLLSGKKFHQSSIAYITENSRFQFNKIRFLNLFQQSPLLNLILITSIIFLLLILFLLITKKSSSLKKIIVPTILPLIFINITINFIYQFAKMGLPNIIDSYRTGQFLSIFSVISIGSIFFSLLSLIKGNSKNKSPFSRMNSQDSSELQAKKFRYYFLASSKKDQNIKILNLFLLIILITCSIIFSNYTVFSQNGLIKSPQTSPNEYNDSVFTYLKINNNFKFGDWLIVAPTEQYQQALGNGFHKELWLFTKEINAQNNKPYYLKNEYIFFFVEKYPLGSSKVSVNKKYAKRKLPNLKSNLYDYYKNPKYRKIIESKAYIWAKAFRKQNKQLKIFYNSKNLTVFMLKQDVKKPLNLKLTKK